MLVSETVLNIKARGYAWSLHPPRRGAMQWHELSEVKPQYQHSVPVVLPSHSPLTERKHRPNLRALNSTLYSIPTYPSFEACDMRRLYIVKSHMPTTLYLRSTADVSLQGKL